MSTSDPVGLPYPPIAPSGPLARSGPSGNQRSRDSRTALTYLAVAAFCGVFAAVYEHFSHGVYSAWMVLLFAWPLLAGAVPYAIAALLTRHASVPVGRGRDWARLCHHAAIATATIGACLSGVLEIYGTTSDWLAWYWAAAAVLATTALGLAVGSRQRQARHSPARLG
ncbi:MAG: hypothetical protein VB093_17295 [Propionicimonas sp.]|nr:hypothetical protein [Propionicimonas sp.]